MERLSAQEIAQHISDPFVLRRSTGNLIKGRTEKLPIRGSAELAKQERLGFNIPNEQERLLIRL